MDFSGLSIKEKGDLIYELEKDCYEEKPVSIDEFLDNPEYLGSFFIDPSTGKSNFYPFWREILREIYPSPFISPVSEIIGLLPIGSGKSFTSNVSLMYEIYLLQCLKEPQKYFGIYPEDTKIVLVVFSSSLAVSENVNWPPIKGYLEKSPWFNRNCPVATDGRKKEISKDLIVDLPKNVSIQFGSTELHSIGRAVICGVLDEANFQREKSEQAYKSYTSIARRRESRFLKKGGWLPGKLWLISSPKFSSDFLSKRLEITKDISRVKKIYDTPIWVVNKGSYKDVYGGETFKVFVGDETSDPKVLDGESPKHYNPSKIYDVPVEYKDSFRSDLLTSIKDIIGVSSVPESALFPSVTMVKSLMTVRHRFSKEILELDFNNPEDKIENYADMLYLSSPAHPECPRNIHIDIGLTNDKFGLGASYHYLEYLDNNIQRRRYVTDMVLSVKAKKGQEVPLTKIVDFLFFLKRSGYPIKKITYDMWGRGLFSQMLSQEFETEYLSVDRTKDAYYNLRSLVYDGLVFLPNHSLLLYELKEMKDTGSKVDHTSLSSKDLSDGVAGSLMSCVQDKDDSFDMPIFIKDKESELKSLFSDSISQRGLKRFL